MTNEQKAAKLEEMAEKKEADATRRIEMAKECHLVLAEEMRVVAARFTADAALLRECAAMMRERGQPGWWRQFEQEYKGKRLSVVEAGPVGWYWYVDGSADYEAEIAPTLESAQAAAVAWVDEQEGRDA